MGPGTTIENSLDGNLQTYTDSDYNNAGADQPGGMPQIYTFELSEVKQLSKVRILPRQDSPNGRVASYEVLVSTNGTVYTSVKVGEADATSAAWIEIPLDVPAEAKFVQLKLRATEENFNAVHVVTTAEVELYEQVTLAEADKTELQKLYNEYKDFTPTYNTNTSVIKAFHSALENADAVLKDEAATQENVTAAINRLRNRYGLMITSEYTYHYSLAVNNGAFTNKHVDFNEYTTDSLKDLVSVYYAAHNHMNTNFNRPQDTEQLYAWYSRFVEAEKKLVKVDANNAYGQMVGLNPEAVSGTKRGTFTVTEEPITDAEGNKKIRLHVTYENNGLDPVSETDVTGEGEWGRSDLKNFSVYMDYQPYAGDGGFKSVTIEDTDAYDGFTFDIDVEPGIYRFELSKNGTKSATAGYYHTNVIEEETPDTEAPKIEKREWSTRGATNDPVVVTLTFSEPIKTLVEKVDGKPTDHEWKKLNDVTYQREYTENADYKIYYEDLAGNACKREELLIVDNYFKDPLVRDVYFTDVHVDKGSHVEIELNAKPYEIADPNGEYVFKDGKHLLILNEEALATNDYYDMMCLYGNDTEDTSKFPATWSYIYRDENGKLSVGRIERVKQPEVVLTVGDKEYNLNENSGEFGKPFVLPESGVLGEPITVSVKAPYIGDYRNNKPITTVQLTGVGGENPTAGDVATNHQSAQLKLVSQDGTTKSGTYCLTVNYNFSPDNYATYYVKVNYKKAEVDKRQLAFQISLAEKAIANERLYNHNEAWDNMLKAHEEAVDVYENPNATQAIVDEATKKLATSILLIRMEAVAPVFSGVEDDGIYNHDVTYDVYDQSLDVIIVDGVRYDNPADAPRTITTEGKHVITAMDEDKGLPGLHKETTVTFVIDKTNPIVEVLDEKGSAVGSTYEMTLKIGDKYVEYGAYVKDNLDGEHKLSNPTAIYYVGADGKAIAVDAVDTNKVGEYRLEYQFTDKAGNQQIARRIVKVIETNVPIDPQEPTDPSNPIKPVDPQQPEGSKDSINTGDATNIASVLLLLVSGAGLVLLKKKSRQ